MDNLTHSLLGVALSKTRLGALHPRAAALLVVAANLPDVEVLSAAWGREAYLVHHRGITHSVLGALALAVAMAACVRWWDRRRAGPRASWCALLGLCGLGVATHLLLDLLNTYGLRPWLPFDATWYYGDLVFIAEPWLWLGLGAAAALAGPRTRAGSLALALVAAACSVVVYATDRLPDGFLYVWPVALALIALGRMYGLGSERPHIVQWTVGGLLAAYLLFLGEQSRQAREAVQARAEYRGFPWARHRGLVAEPHPADPFTWTVLVDTPDRVVEDVVTHVGSGGGFSTEPWVCERHFDDPAVVRALASELTAWWRSFARLGYAETEASEDGTLVRLIDARYRAPWCTAVVLVRTDGRVEALDAGAGSASRTPLRSAR